MFVTRYLLLLLILFQSAFVAESNAGEFFSVPYYNESKTAPVYSFGAWMPDYMSDNASAGYQDQNISHGPRTTNPWALPAPQWMPVVPRYLGSDFFRKNNVRQPIFGQSDSSQSAQYMSQPTNQYIDNQYTVSPTFQANNQPSKQPSHPINSQPFVKQPYAESSWQQPSVQQMHSNVPASGASMYNFQSNPRFVTQDTLEALNRQQEQTQQLFPLKRHQNWAQKNASCCQNRHAQTRSRNYTQQSQQVMNNQNAQQVYGYSNGMDMPFAMDAEQLRRQRLLYKGDSLPTVPDAAISGLPPMNIFEPLPPVLSSSDADIDWGTNRFGVGPYGDFLQR